jgi:mRNA interferase RelE/StbE
MSFNLGFLPSARKEWDKLGATIRQQFVNKLKERLTAPRVPGAAPHGMLDHYKIKLRQAGYRLVYRVNDETITVLVVAVGKRERNQVYDLARKR